MDDIITILSLGSSALVYALCDFRRLVHAGESMLEEDKLGKTERPTRTIVGRMVTLEPQRVIYYSSVNSS